MMTHWLGRLVSNSGTALVEAAIVKHPVRGPSFRTSSKRYAGPFPGVDR